MKLKMLVLLVTLLAFTGSTYGQSISLDQVDGLVDGNLPLDGSAVFYLRLATGDNNPAGVTNGFRVYSPDGATWTSAVIDSQGVFPSTMLDQQFLINDFSTGSGADTVGFGAFRLFGTGIPAGFDDVFARITVGPIPAADEGKTICLDSSWYRPSGIWKWALGSSDVFPDWDGPHCYTIGAPPPPFVDVVLPSGGEVIPYGDPVGIVWTSNVSCDWDVSYNIDGGPWTAIGTTSDTIFSWTPPPVAATEVMFRVSCSAYEIAGTSGVISIEGPPANMVVDPDTLYFYGTQGGSIPVTDSFMVSFDDGSNVPFTAGSVMPYLLISPDSAVTPAAIHVGVDISGMSAGTYYDTVVFDADDAANSMEYGIVVTNIEPPRPQLVVDPDTLFFFGQVGSPDPGPQPFLVTELIGRNIPYTVVESGDWIEVSKTFGTTPDSVFVTVDQSTLAAGVHYYDITVSDAPEDKSFETVTVCFDLSEEPNNPPTIDIPDSVYVCADDIIIVDIYATDADEDQLTIWVDTLYENMIFDDSGNGTAYIMFQPTMAQVGSWWVMAYVTDGIDTAYNDIQFIVEDCTPPCSEMTLSDTAFYFAMYEGDANPTPQIIEVMTSDAPFAYDFNYPTTPWLSIDPYHDTASSSSSLIVDGSALGVGEYSVQVAVQALDEHVCEPATQYFTVYLDVIIPPSDEDFVTIQTVPAVPGAWIKMPIKIEHVCDLTALEVSFGPQGSWEGIELDSVSFVGSVAEGWGNLTYTEGENMGTISGSMLLVEDMIPAGVGTLATLYFTIGQEVPHGFYPAVVLDPAPMFTYNCGAGPVTVIPEGIDGGIVVGSADNYVCGYVVDCETGHQIEGATVELWADFPFDNYDDQTWTDVTGLFQFFNSQVIPFDLYAYKEGYYPAKVENLNFGQAGIMICLQKVEPVTPTDEWVNFYCDLNTYMGAPLPAGSVIDAFDPDNVHCGSFFVSTPGVYGFLPVYHDDIYTIEDEGAEPGDEITFYINGVQAYTADAAIWTVNGDAHEVCFHAGDILVREIPLTEGWNLISWNVDTESDDVSDVMANIMHCLDVVEGFENGALTYDPDFPLFSTLQQVDHMSGYWVRVSCDVTLQVVGTAVPNVTPIALNNGWNLVSYLPDETLPVAAALGSCHDDLDVAQSETETYIPGNDIYNTLSDMSNGLGYWLRMIRPSELIYPASGPRVSPQVNPQALAAAKTSGIVVATNTWVNMYSENLTLDGQQVGIGSVITAHLEDGTMVGYHQMTRNGLFGFMPVYGDDFATERLDGANKGDAITLKVDGVETNETFTFADFGELIEVKSLTAKGNGNPATPDSYSLSQNYPNPFNPSTTIRFSLPSAGEAKIEVYNVLGRLVSVPFDGYASAGTNEVMWNGKNNSGAPVASGIYFYRLISGNYTETRKMTLLK